MNIPNLRKSLFVAGVGVILIGFFLIGLTRNDIVSGEAYFATGVSVVACGMTFFIAPWIMHTSIRYRIQMTLLALGLVLANVTFVIIKSTHSPYDPFQNPFSLVLCGFSAGLFFFTYVWDGTGKSN